MGIKESPPSMAIVLVLLLAVMVCEADRGDVVSWNPSYDTSTSRSTSIAPQQYASNSRPQSVNRVSHPIMISAAELESPAARHRSPPSNRASASNTLHARGRGPAIHPSRGQNEGANRGGHRWEGSKGATEAKAGAFCVASSGDVEIRPHYNHQQNIRTGRPLINQHHSSSGSSGHGSASVSGASRSGGSKGNRGSNRPGFHMATSEDVAINNGKNGGGGRGNSGTSRMKFQGNRGFDVATIENVGMNNRSYGQHGADNSKIHYADVIRSGRSGSGSRGSRGSDRKEFHMATSDEVAINRNYGQNGAGNMRIHAKDVIRSGNRGGGRPHEATERFHSNFGEGISLSQIDDSPGVENPRADYPGSDYAGRDYPGADYPGVENPCADYSGDYNGAFNADPKSTIDCEDGSGNNGGSTEGGSTGGGSGGNAGGSTSDGNSGSDNSGNNDGNADGNSGGGNSGNNGGSSGGGGMDIEAILEEHNAARREVGVADLAWDEGVAAAAADWAGQLASRGCLMEHGGAEGLGQNLYWRSPAELSPEEDRMAVQSWVGEKADWTHSPIPDGCVEGKMCGHYTQVVWGATTHVGGASAQCPDRSGMWVCDYSAPGNFIGQTPF